MAARDIGSPEHPWMFLNAEEWESLADRIEDPFFAKLHDNNVRVLEALAAGQGADRRGRLGGARRLKQRLLRSTVAWYVTREEAHLHEAVRALEESCSAEGWRVHGSRIGGVRAAGLSTGELIFNVCFGYDALHTYLTPEQKDMCLTALIEKGLDAYLDGVEKQDWWLRCNFNWNSALHGNAGLAALVVSGTDPELADRALGCALEGLPHLIGAFKPGGGYIEGLMYMCTAIGHLTDFVVPYHRLTGDDLGLLQNTAFHETISFFFNMFGGDGRIYNLSDSREGQGGGIPHMFWWARMVNRPDWTHELERRMRPGGPRGGLFQDVEAFWYRTPWQESSPPERKRLHHFRGVDWMAWQGDRTWLTFRSGFNGGNHDNDDLGNLILGIDDERFLVDPGYGATKASQHNCVTVRRHEQTDGATAHITRLEENDGGFYLSCDLTEAFPHVLRHYWRHLLLIADMHLLLLDDILTKGGLRNDMLGYFQVRLPAEITPEGFLVRGERNTLRIAFLSDAGFFRIKPYEHGKQEFQALSWSDVYYRSHTVQPILLTFGEPALEHELTPEGFRLVLDGTAFSFTKRGDALCFDGFTA